MTDLTYFIQSKLKPAIWHHIQQVFPQLKFEEHTTSKGKEWWSPKHVDLGAYTGERKDRCVITEGKPYAIWDNGYQRATETIKAYQQLNDIPDFWDAVKKLCAIVGLPTPERSPEQVEQYRKCEERQQVLETSTLRQQAALFTPEGKEVLDYLHGRGWTDEEVKEAKLGYISKDEARTIDAQYPIGYTHTLSIPLRSLHALYGFNARAVKPLPEGRKNKYAITEWTEKKGNFFNLSGIQKAQGRIVVVEGELDALHADVKGFKGMVATSGGNLTEDLLDQALNQGIKTIVLLFDADEKGEEFIQESIDVAYKKGISLHVATFPEGETLQNGTKIHDVDEYLQAHSVDELEALVNNAEWGTLYLYEKKRREYEGDDVPKVKASQLLHEVYNLGLSTQNRTEREMLYNACSSDFKRNGDVAFSADAIRAEVERQEETSTALHQKEDAQKLIEKANALFKEGKVKAALSEMAKAESISQRYSDVEEFSRLLALPTAESREEKRKNYKGADDIETEYYFQTTGSNKEIERLTLSSGAITFVCAPTSHGKSTFLQNLALQAARGTADGSVLYFTYEESAEAVEQQFVNKYIGKALSANNGRSISTYIRKSVDFFSNGGLETYKQGDAAFAKELLYSGKLRIYEEDFDSTKLINFIKFTNNREKVKAVFVDYIQLLHKNGCRKDTREELKEIGNDLKTLAVSLNIPIIVAAQLNRDAKSPAEMYAQNIAESADLERVANKVILLWNGRFKAQKGCDEKAMKDWKESTGIELPNGERIYALLAKNRGGIANIEAVFTYNGNIGSVKQQMPTLQQIEERERGINGNTLRTGNIVRGLPF